MNCKANDLPYSKTLSYSASKQSPFIAHYTNTPITSKNHNSANLNKDNNALPLIQMKFWLFKVWGTSWPFNHHTRPDCNVCLSHSEPKHTIPVAFMVYSAHCVQSAYPTWTHENTMNIHYKCFNTRINRQLKLANAMQCLSM